MKRKVFRKMSSVAALTLAVTLAMSICAWAGTRSEERGSILSAGQPELPNTKQIKEIVGLYDEDVVSEYPPRHYNLSVHTKNSMYSETQIYDRGDYYEVTNMLLTINTTLDADYVESKQVGDTIEVNAKKWTVKRIWPDGTVELDDDDGWEWNHYLLWKTKKGYTVLTTVGDTEIDTITLYDGNLYFSKDCKVIGHPDGAGESSTGQLVSIDEYLFEEHDYDESRKKYIGKNYQHGRDGDYFSIDGHFKIDDRGIIIEYEEQFRS